MPCQTHALTEALNFLMDGWTLSMVSPVFAAHTMHGHSAVMAEFKTYLSNLTVVILSGLFNSHMKFKSKEMCCGFSGEQRSYQE